MNAISTDELLVRLTVDDARAARLAGVTFARRLFGAHATDFAWALAEQERSVKRAIVEAGYSAEQARLTAQRFAAAAQDEWQIEAASGGYLQETA